MLNKMFALMLCALCCAGVSAQTAARVHHVVFVITSPDVNDWQSATMLAQHYLEGIRPATAEVEVLAYGGGIDMLKQGAATAQELADTQKMGVHFVACENAMRAHHIAKADLLPGVTSVPSGVVELVGKQEAGWSYVKVGK